MATMRLQATFWPARKLKSIVQVIQGLAQDEALMRVNHEAITIIILNQTQTAPFYITLSSDWFIHYDFYFDPGESWTMCFSIQVLCDTVLVHAEDENIVDIKGNVRNGSGDGHVIFTFKQRTSNRLRRRTHSMVVHGYALQNLPYMDYSHGQGFHLEIQPRSLVHALENGILRFFSLHISSANVFVVVKADQIPYTLTRGADYDVLNVPEEGGVRYSLCMHPEHLLSFHRAVVRSNRIIVMTAPPALNPHPWPILVAGIDQETAWFTFPFNSSPIF